MTAKYVQPDPHPSVTRYTCPHCHVLTSHRRLSVESELDSGHPATFGLTVKRCSECQTVAIWKEAKLIYPVGVSTSPPPNPDMPESIRLEYEEARSIAELSPRGAAVLLRFALQKLLQELAGHKGDVDPLIHELEANGMDSRIGNMFHGVRIIGNNAAHPLDIDLNENPALVAASFQLLNYIVDDQISKPKHLDAFYAQLPEDAVKGIEDKRRGAAKKRENQSA